jgi:iron complex outermembrane receptor protein
VFVFTQQDARFRGLEVVTHTHVMSRGEAHLELDASADYVRASLKGGGNLPRIPPMRLGVGLRLHGGPWNAMLELRRSFAQNRVAGFETTTPGHTLLNAFVSYRFFAGNTIHDLMLRGTNLTDAMARAHTSPLKEVAPLPGRDLTLSYRLGF